MKEILKRLKSPVVIGQLVTNIAGIVILLIPESTELTNQIVIVLMLLINTFAGFNDPTETNKF
jgi:hypothetical protein